MRGDECGRLSFVADMNFDGVITISDVIGWLHYFFFFPAKVVTAMVYNSSKLKEFFEMDCFTGSGLGGITISILAWLIFLHVLGAMAVTSSRSGT